MRTSTQGDTEICAQAYTHTHIHTKEGREGGRKEKSLLKQCEWQWRWGAVSTVPTSVAFHVQPKFLVPRSTKRPILLCELRSPVLSPRASLTQTGLTYKDFLRVAPCLRGTSFCPLSACPS